MRKWLGHSLAVDIDDPAADFDEFAGERHDPLDEQLIHIGQADDDNVVALRSVQAIADLVDNQTLMRMQIWFHALAKDDRCLGQKEMHDKGKDKGGNHDLSGFGKCLPCCLPGRHFRLARLDPLHIEFDQILLFFHSYATQTIPVKPASAGAT